MRVINHQSLRHRLRDPSFSPCNGCLSPKHDKALSLALLACFKAFDSCYSDMSLSSVSIKQFSYQVRAKLAGLGILNPDEAIRQGGIGIDVLTSTMHRFWSSSRRLGQCPATVSVVGACAAQEAIKAITHVHLPADQFFVFESLHSLPTSALDDLAAETTCNTHQESLNQFIEPTELVYGKELHNELKQLRVFVVGSGAIGCELLKTFALLGVGEMAPLPQDSSAGVPDGLISITDMDHIEKSNLNRQLLFRHQDVGQPKAEVAARAAKLINPRLNIRPYLKRVGTETEDIFNSTFWSNDVDIIATALDNVQARQYIDSQAVLRKMWLLDSGTLGTKGNTQTIIPYITESYGSSADPPEEAIPVCTLKSFPYQPDHCIAWGRALYDQVFVQDINMIKELVLKLEGLADRFYGQRKPIVSDSSLIEPIRVAHYHQLPLQGISIPSDGEVKPLIEQESVNEPQSAVSDSLVESLAETDTTIVDAVEEDEINLDEVDNESALHIEESESTSIPVIEAEDTFDIEEHKPGVDVSTMTNETISISDDSVQVGRYDPALLKDLHDTLSVYSVDDLARVVAALEHYPVSTAVSAAVTSSPEALQLVNWAFDFFHSVFYKEIVELLTKHPPDSLDEDDSEFSPEAPHLFWSGSRKLPRLLSHYNHSDTVHRDFIIQSSSIRARHLGLTLTLEDIEEAISVLIGLSHSEQAVVNDAPSRRETLDLSSYKEYRHPKFIETAVSEVSMDELAYRCYDLIVSESESVVKLMSRKLDSMSTEEFEKDNLSLGTRILM